MKKDEDDLFADGFGRFLASGEFSDLTLVTKEREYKAHKLIIGYSSDYFNKQLENVEENVLILQGPFTKDFHFVLQFMYEGSVEFTADNSIPLLAMANYYSIKDLKRAVSDYLISNVSRENALPMLQEALQYNSEEMASKCLQVITKNFSPIVETGGNFNGLPPSILTSIIRRNNLSVASEMVVYETVKEYIKRNTSLTREDIVNLFESIRFPFMSKEQLKEIEMDPLVPRDLLIEALTEKNKYQVEDGKEEEHKSLRRISFSDPRIHTDSNDTFSRLMPRQAYAISLEYSSDFDDKGVFYYIGTKGWTEPWSNPAARGRVRVKFSSSAKGNIVNLLDRNPSEFWTSDVPASWVQGRRGIFYLTVSELGQFSNVGSKLLHFETWRYLYSLVEYSHEGNAKSDLLRNWTLQGSNDATTWVSLKRHANDVSLNASFATASWPIKDCTQYFRHFRILQTGHNSSGNNFLSLCGFELYGDLYGVKKDGYISP